MATHQLNHVLSQYAQPLRWVAIPNDNTPKRHVAVMAIPDDKALYTSVGGGYQHQQTIPEKARFIGFAGGRGNEAVASWVLAETIEEAAWEAFCQSTSQQGKRMRRIRRQSGLESAQDMQTFLLTAESETYVDGAMTPVFLPTSHRDVIVRYATDSEEIYDSYEYDNDTSDAQYTSSDESHRLYQVMEPKPDAQVPSLYEGGFINAPAPLWATALDSHTYVVVGFYNDDDYYHARQNCLKLIGVTGNLRDAYEVMRAIEHAHALRNDWSLHAVGIYHLPLMEKLTENVSAVEPIAVAGQLLGNTR